MLKDDKVLLLFKQGGRVVTDVWTGSAGGHFEENELNDAKACVLRELKEELGLEEENLQNLSLRYIALRSTNGEIRQNYYFFANLKGDVTSDLYSNEGTLQWFSLEEVNVLDMPLTAKGVIEHYCEIGRFTEELYIGVTKEDGVAFLELPVMHLLLSLLF